MVDTFNNIQYNTIEIKLNELNYSKSFSFISIVLYCMLLNVSAILVIKDEYTYIECTYRLMFADYTESDGH